MNQINKSLISWKVEQTVVEKPAGRDLKVLGVCIWRIKIMERKFQIFGYATERYSIGINFY